MAIPNKEYFDLKFENLDQKLTDFDERLSKVEKKSDANEKFRYILTGVGILAGLIIGIFEFTIKK